MFLSWNSLTSNRAACSCAGKTTPPSRGDFSAGSSATENRQFCVFARLLLQILVCISVTFNRLLICSLVFSLSVNFLVDCLLIVLRFVDATDVNKRIDVYYSCHVFCISQRFKNKKLLKQHITILINFSENTSKQ